MLGGVISPDIKLIDGTLDNGNPYKGIYITNI